MGAVDDWLREHALLHTTTGAYDPNVHSLVEESVGAQKRGIRCAEHANEVYNHSKRSVPRQSDAMEPIELERRAFAGQAECDLLPRERDQVRGHLGVVWRLRQNWNIPAGRGRLDPIALQGIVVGWNRRVPHGINIATFGDHGEVEEVFTSTTVRTRDTVFPLFGDAGTKSATVVELQEFGESVRVRPEEA